MVGIFLSRVLAFDLEVCTVYTCFVSSNMNEWFQGFLPNKLKRKFTSKFYFSWHLFKLPVCYIRKCRFHNTASEIYFRKKKKLVSGTSHGGVVDSGEVGFNSVPVIGLWLRFQVSMYLNILRRFLRNT